MAEKNKTPWPVIFAGLSGILAVLTTLGYLVLQPIQRDIDALTKAIVPRAEHQVHWEEFDRRITKLEDRKLGGG